MKVSYLIHILPTGEGSWDKIVRTLHISPFNPNRLGELKEDIERFRPVGSIVTIQYSIPSIKISFLTASQKEAFINEYISDSRIIANEKQIAFDDWRTKAMINKKFEERDEPKYFVVSSEGYSPIRCLPDIPNCVWPTETKTLKAGDTITFDYKIDDSTIYPHVDIIKEADEWLDTDKMWDMFIKHYTDDSLPEGVAIVKEEKDMAGYKLKDARSNLKLYMVEDKPTYTPRGAVRGIAHKIEELPEAIRNVQFNEKKGVVTVIWIDGKVTMAKCGPNDIWDPEKGLAIAIMKRWFKSTTSMNKWIKGIIPEGCEAESLMDQLIHLYCQKDVEAVTEAFELQQKVNGETTK